MKLFIVLIISCLSLNVIAQSKRTIIDKKVKMIRTLEQDIDQGEKSLLMEKEEFFNEKGELVELKEYDEKGRIKKWEQYKYSAEGKLIEERFLDYKGKTEKRIEHIFEDGLKVEKLYFDDRNRLYKKKKYEVEFR